MKVLKPDHTRRVSGALRHVLKNVSRPMILTDRLFDHLALLVSRDQSRISRYITAPENDYLVEPRILTGGSTMTDWDAVVSQHVAIVRRTIYRIVGNDADAWDCVQETFLQAVKIDRREPIGNWPALLRRVATVRALDLLRNRSRQRNRSSPDGDPFQATSREPSPSGCAEASELADRLRAAVGRLPRRQAEVFCLSCFEQMSSEDIAEQLQISATATRMLLSRARRRLERLLEPFGGATEEAKRTQ